MFETPPGATPLSDGDIAGLIPTYLSTRGDLNAVEAENIAQARVVLRKQAARYADIDFLLYDSTIKGLHRAMFGNVWKWAGTYRTRVTNIGVLPEQIPTMTRDLLLNTRERLKFCTVSNRSESDELALRFHWSLVRIHPFPNGNGRHARLVADLLIQALGHPAFSWGPNDLVDPNASRTAYIAALREADETLGDVKALMLFARPPH